MRMREKFTAPKPVTRRMPRANVFGFRERQYFRNRKPAYVCLAGGVLCAQHFALCSCVPAVELRLCSNTTKWFMISNESIFDQKGPKALLH